LQLAASTLPLAAPPRESFRRIASAQLHTVVPVRSVGPGGAADAGTVDGVHINSVLDSTLDTGDSATNRHEATNNAALTVTNNAALAVPPLYSIR
jgi:hypothetical protein